MRTRQVLALAVAVVPLLTGCGVAHAQAGADDITGVWLNESKNGEVEIYRDGDTYAGRIVAVIPPNGPDGGPKRDARNPDPALRSRPLQGLVTLTGLKYEGSGTWGGGRIYGPDNGKTYSLSATMPDRNQLTLRGYIGVPLLGGAKTWTRVTAPR